MTGPSGRDLRLALDAAAMDLRGFVQLTRQIWCCLWRRGGTTAAAATVTKETMTSVTTSVTSSVTRTSPVCVQTSAVAAAACDVCQQHRVQPISADLSSRDVADQTSMTVGGAGVKSRDQRSTQHDRLPHASTTNTKGKHDVISGVISSSSPRTSPPHRLKASGKGLLERRGSNASLTLDLGPLATDSPPVGSPPTECSSAEEFLTSATHRMNRRQLVDLLHNPLALHEEFWKIPMNHADKISVAGSGIKNRYHTIIPNESTRVVLTSSTANAATSYINANYIRGYGGEARAYIATQGPMTNTVNDFWAMVWQEKSPAIVMITKLTEHKRAKCECYMPDHCAVYGDIEVTVRDSHVDVVFGCTRRLLVLKLVGRSGDTTAAAADTVHHLIHYWCSSWPDHQAPRATDQLLRLVVEVERLRLDPDTGRHSGPVIVHCSAGIGRTGCFIAISIAVQQLVREHAVDILSIICGLRLDRGGMVQTNEQYEFVHYAVSVFDVNSSPVNTSPSLSSSSSSTSPTHDDDDDDDVCDLK